jgi:hypothetical protein
MLKKFFVPVLNEEGPNDVLFQQDAVPSHFHMKVTDFLNGVFPEKFGHLIQLTLVPLIFFPFGCISGMLCICHLWLPLCQNLLAGYAD